MKIYVASEFHKTIWKLKPSSQAYKLTFMKVHVFRIWVDVPGCRQILSLTRKETSSEACRGRARFQQHRDASCHQVIFFTLQGKTLKGIHTILTETLVCFLTGRSKDLSAPL